MEKELAWLDAAMVAILNAINFSSIRLLDARKRRGEMKGRNWSDVIMQVSDMTTVILFIVTGTRFSICFRSPMSFQL